MKIQCVILSIDFLHANIIEIGIINFETTKKADGTNFKFHYVRCSKNKFKFVMHLEFWYSSDTEECKSNMKIKMIYKYIL